MISSTKATVLITILILFLISVVVINININCSTRDDSAVGISASESSSGMTNTPEIKARAYQDEAIGSGEYVFTATVESIRYDENINYIKYVTFSNGRTYNFKTTQSGSLRKGKTYKITYTESSPENKDLFLYLSKSEIIK